MYPIAHFRKFACFGDSRGCGCNFMNLFALFFFFFFLLHFSIIFLLFTIRIIILENICIKWKLKKGKRVGVVE